MWDNLVFFNPKIAKKNWWFTLKFAQFSNFSMSAEYDFNDLFLQAILIKPLMDSFTRTKNDKYFYYWTLFEAFIEILFFSSNLIPFF